MADDVVADDDFDVTADLAAAFEAAEQAEAPVEAEPVETEQEKSDRVRDEKGRFAKTGDETVKAEAPAEAASSPAPAVAAIPEAPPAVASGEPVKPPPGFSPTAKVVWDKETLSKEEWEAVKRDIAKRNDEVGKGFEKLAEWKPIERYAEMARQGGTTLERALENYVSIERELSRDFIAGVSRLCQNAGIAPLALANQILARNGVATSEGQPGSQPAHQPANVDLTPITNELNALKNYVQQQQTATVQNEIQRFASDPKHTFFENVKADMGILMNAGKAATMEEAYDMACWANKEIRELLIKQQSAVPVPSAKVAAATQARAAAKSITGSPIPNASAKGPEISLEDEIRQLMDASV